MKRFACAGLAAILLGSASDAEAQMSFSPGWASWGGAVTGGSVMASAAERARSAHAAGRSAGVTSPAARQAQAGNVTTTYRADPAVSARVRRQFLAFVAHDAGTKAATDLGANFTKDDPLASWARASAADGMRPGDVADAMAEYWVTNWLMANRRTDAPPDRVRAARDQMRRMLTSNPVFSRLDNSERQEMAEVFMYNAVVQASAYKLAVQAHDQTLARRLGDAAASRFRKEVHIDLHSMALTPAGFESKA